MGAGLSFSSSPSSSLLLDKDGVVCREFGGCSSLPYTSFDEGLDLNRAMELGECSSRISGSYEGDGAIFPRGLNLCSLSRGERMCRALWRRITLVEGCVWLTRGMRRHWIYLSQFFVA